MPHALLPNPHIVSVEYDLVVIGGTMAGRYAALAAARLQARVALVEPYLPEKPWLDAESIYSQVLTQVGQIAQQLSKVDQFGIYGQTTDLVASPLIPSVRFADVWAWTQAVLSTLQEQDSPAILASLGVDVIQGSGEFCRQPHVTFIVNERRLRARTYLIATGSSPLIPNIEGLETTGYLTLADLGQPEISKRLSGNWVVIGAKPVGIELAQALVRLGVKVTLAVKSSHILPKEDADVACLLQAQLEAEGVRVLTESAVTQAKLIQDKKWILAGNQAIETDEILIASGQMPNVESLNLAAVGVKWNQHGIQVNQKLQTTNPQIYACGDVIGGYQFAQLANYEVTIAVKNALFFPIFKVNYRGIPWAIFSDPILARVGMTEEKARQRYGDVLVLRQYFKTMSKALLMGETTGFCKIIVRQNGEILGSSIVGADADQLIGAIALAIRQGLKVGAIADLPAISPSFSEILQQTAAEWHQQRLSSNASLKNFLEWFFQWLRSLSK